MERKNISSKTFTSRRYTFTKPIEKRETSTSKLNQVFYVPIATAYIYFCCFVYEAAQCAELSIPVSFINISINQILILGALTVLYTFFFGFVGHVFMNLFEPIVIGHERGMWLLFGIIFFLLTLLYLVYDIANLQINFLLWISVSIVILIIYVYIIIKIFHFIDSLKEKVRIKIEPVLAEQTEDVKTKSLSNDSNWFWDLFNFYTFLCVTFFPFIVYYMDVM